MSLPSRDRTLLPVPGKNSSRVRFALALRRAVQASPAPAKELARRLGLSPRGAALLLRGDSAPSFETLVCACQAWDEAWNVLREICGRDGKCGDAEQLLDELAARLKERGR